LSTSPAAIGRIRTSCPFAVLGDLSNPYPAPGPVQLGAHGRGSLKHRNLTPNVPAGQPSPRPRLPPGVHHRQPGSWAWAATRTCTSPTPASHRRPAGPSAHCVLVEQAQIMVGLAGRSSGVGHIARQEIMRRAWSWILGCSRMRPSRRRWAGRVRGWVSDRRSARRCCAESAGSSRPGCVGGGAAMGSPLCWTWPPSTSSTVPISSPWLHQRLARRRVDQQGSAVRLTCCTYLGVLPAE
jgi:hypothetical protein